MDFSFYWALLRMRLHYVVLFVVLGSALGVTVALVLPERYVAEARLVVESQQIPDTLAASTVQTDAVEQLQIIRQRILARDRLLDLSGRFRLHAPEDGEALSPDAIVADMRRRIRIDTSGGVRRNQPGAVLVDVSFEAGGAGAAAAVANELVTLILEENVSMRTTVSGQTLDFFEGEVERLDRELAERAEAVARFQEENRDALPESLEFRRGQLVAAQERLVEIEREIDRLRERRRSLEAIFAATGSLEPATAQPALTPEESELRRLRERYASNSAVLSDSNPRMRVLVTQIEALEARVEAQAEERRAAAAGTSAEGTDDAPPSAYELQLAEIDDQIAFLDGRRPEIEERMAELSRTIQATPNNAITLERLARDLEATRGQYDRAVEARARAETGDTIEALSKGQRIAVIENATAPGAPNSPDRQRIALAGFGGGLLAGLGLVVLFEILNTSVRRGAEIERGLEITPIATLSYMPTRAETARRRALIVAAFVVAAAGIPAGIWVVDTYYRPVDLLVEDLLDRLPDIPLITDRGGLI